MLALRAEGGSDLSDIGQNNMWMVLLSNPLSCPAIITITVNSLFILITHNRCWLPIAHVTSVCETERSQNANIALGS